MRARSFRPPRAGMIPALAAALMLAGPAALAQPFDRTQALAEPPSLAGAYRLSNADGDRTCSLTLLAAPLAPGKATAGASGAGAGGSSANRATAKSAAGEPLSAVELDRSACAASILFAGSIAAWAPGPGNAIRLYGAEGKLVAEFTEGVGGTWEALREEDGVYFLINPQLAEETAPVQPADLVGAWELAGTGEPPACRLRLTDTARGDAFRLEAEPACAALLGRRLPTLWRLHTGDLLLDGGEVPLRFVAGEDGAWTKVPEESASLTLSRAP